MRPHPRRARVDASRPAAWATSDRNGMVGNQRDLRWQFDWAGTQLINKRILVWEDELDTPQPQLKTLILPPDPVSIRYARPEPYPIDELWPMLYENKSVFPDGFGGSPGPTGGGDALPLYLEKSSTGSVKTTMAFELESSSIPMTAPTS